MNAAARDMEAMIRMRREEEVECLLRGSRASSAMLLHTLVAVNLSSHVSDLILHNTTTVSTLSCRRHYFISSQF